jgi:hypothetical protein
MGKNTNCEELKAGPGDILKLAPGDTQTERDILKLHILYLEKLTDMRHTERAYFSNSYLPYLFLKLALVEERNMEDIEHVSISGVNTDEYRRRVGDGLGPIKLRQFPATVTGVHIALNHLKYANGFSRQLMDDEHSVDYKLGVINFTGKGMRPTVRASLAITDYYSIFVVYTGKQKNTVNVGRANNGD